MQGPAQRAAERLAPRFRRSALAEGRAPEPQDPGGGTSHRIRDIDAISRIDLDATFRAGDLIDLLRALTSPPQSRGAYFEHDDRRIYVTMELTEENDGQS